MLPAYACAMSGSNSRPACTLQEQRGCAFRQSCGVSWPPRRGSREQPTTSCRRDSADEKQGAALQHRVLTGSRIARRSICSASSRKTYHPVTVKRRFSIAMVNPDAGLWDVGNKGKDGPCRRGRRCAPRYAVTVGEAFVGWNQRARAGQRRDLPRDGPEMTMTQRSCPQYAAAIGRSADGTRRRRAFLGPVAHRYRTSTTTPGPPSAA
ncbi:hypothetical protein B0H67DRAFT_357922 [Lasiosphaeris hirsuta]|uniref:Uncharacterized protein n=1 Tax=Lasiosphaeris hirsuta TaxID=260670 RepID=A0AA39ZWB5_9PEZI|nr:hypothetical protein B0H67DRAFT_357922 [Lasiosphaeris hirsuta]